MVLVGGCTGVTSDVGAPSTYLVFGIFYQDMIFAIPVIANKHKPYTGSLWNSKECNACKFWWVCSITSCVCRSLGLRNQDELLKFGTYGACCILLEIKSVFLQTSFFLQNLAIIFVRLGFFKVSGPLSTCFEISIWNLIYTLWRWRHASSSSFILLGTLWHTSQPKIGQSNFSAFMAS